VNSITFSITLIVALFFISCNSSNTCTGKIFGDHRWSNPDYFDLSFNEDIDSMYFFIQSFEAKVPSSYRFSSDCDTLHIGQNLLINFGLIGPTWLINSYNSSNVNVTDLITQQQFTLIKQ
jgi:hypothetical protein